MKTQTDRVNFTLRQEYGFLLPDLENIEEWDVWEVDINLIDAFEGHMQHVNQNTVQGYRGWNAPTVVCLCIPNGKRFRLIDGRPRLTAAKLDGKKEVSILVPASRKNPKAKKLTDDEIRTQALAKLSDEEKRVLGLK